MKTYKVQKILGLALLASSALAVSQSASATITDATSTGYGVGADLQLLGSPLLNLTLPAGVTGTAPPEYGYNKSGSVLAADLNGGTSGILGLNLSTGVAADVEVIGANATTNVDGGAGSRFANADSHIDDLAVSLNVLNLVNLANLSNVTLDSSAQVMGEYGSMSTSGGANITSLDLNLGALLGLPAPLILDSSSFIGAAANTDILPGLLNPLGISLVVNEQLTNGSRNGVCADDSCSFEVNALHLMLDAVDVNLAGAILGVNLGLEVVSLDLELGHSYAEMSAVPVPAAVWLFGSGVLGLVGFGRRRQAQA